jgi:hypothetical protein
MDNLEDLWTGLLSGDEAVVRQIWDDLTDDDARAVSAHLKNMAEDSSFSEEQRQAARRALQAILRTG